MTSKTLNFHGRSECRSLGRLAVDSEKCEVACRADHPMFFFMRLLLFPFKCQAATAVGRELRLELVRRSIYAF